MNRSRTRREFLADVGRGVLVASVGCSTAQELGFGAALASEEGVGKPLSFGAIEPLVALMQETPVNRLLPVLVERLRGGTDLRTLVAAAGLANARTFGGEDYVGFHTLMALSPAYHMSREMPEAQRALPVLKVLVRNTARIQERGGRGGEVLHEVTATPSSGSAASLRDAVRRRDVRGAEAALAAAATRSADQAFNELLEVVQDETDVHRVVLPYRAWDMLDLIGRDRAETLLRQSVRYCVKFEQYVRDTPDAPRSMLPKVLEHHRLLGRSPGDRRPDDAWVEAMCRTFFGGTPLQAAEAAAAALAEGFAPDAVAEAVSLAANQLVLRDAGRPPREESPGKPPGSVHGDSIGVHACDSANAWRNMARVSNARNTFACIIMGAYQVAQDRVGRGGDFLNWEPLPVSRHVQQVAGMDGRRLLGELDEAVRGNLQSRAAALVHQYGALGHPARPVFDALLKYAVSEDGALHAEKYYRTVCEEFAATRPAFRWRQLVALARVTASEYGRPAPGYAEARELLRC